MKDVENRLISYRPAGPASDLRARILREAEGSPAATFGEWLPALTAAGLILVLFMLNSRLHAAIDARLTASVQTRAAGWWWPDEDGGAR